MHHDSGRCSELTDARSRHALLQIDMKCLDGIQGPVYVGSGSCFNRKALYGFDPALAEDDEDEVPVYRSWWCFGNVKESVLKRTRSAVPLLDSNDSDEETEAGTLLEEAGNSYSSIGLDWFGYEM